MKGGIPVVVLIALALVVPVAPIASSGATPGGLEAATEEPQAEQLRVNPDQVEPGLLEDLEPVNHVIVQFEGEVPGHVLERLDLDVRYTFESIPAVYVRASGEAVRTLGTLDAVRYIERADKPIAFDLDTATLATLAREVWDPAADNPHVPGDPDPIEVDGETIDGTGIGIAILDTGIDTTHPDLPAPDKVVRSFLATGEGVVEAPYFSPQDPHGTAVAGVAAGTGEASEGSVAGAGPGASLYSFAVKHASLEEVIGTFKGDPITLYPAVAMDWIAEHGDEQDPPIKVVNNAWHCRFAECRQNAGPEGIHARLASELVEEGITVTWAFGNIERTWNPMATLPIQGVIGVSSTTDLDEGIRNGCRSGFSSEGEPLDPTTWPDVAAPGEKITTTAPVSVDSKRRGPALDPYRDFSGTSLSAPHVAGVTALLLQANPELSPAEVEWILEHNATELPEDLCEAPFQRGDPTHPTSAANHEVGHGLIDAHAAVETAIGFEGIPDTDETAIEPDETWLNPDDLEDVDTVQVHERLYLSGAQGLDETRPSDDQARSLERKAGETVTFTSAPFDEAIDVTGIDASIWVRISTEPVRKPIDNLLADQEVRLRVEQIGPGGALKDAALLTSPSKLSPQARALERPFVQPLGQAMDFERGDRLRIHLTVEESNTAGADAGLADWELFWGSARHPSHIGLGERAPDADDTYRACREHRGGSCAWIDADHPSAMFGAHEACTVCAGGVNELRWEGPGGTGAQFLFHGAAVDGCQIPQAESWGSCTVLVHSTIVGGLGPTECEILDQRAPNLGHGRCQIIGAGF